MELKVKLLNPNAKLPTRGSEHAAGLDLYASEPAEIWPQRDGVIRTGIALEIPHGYYGQIRERSGLARDLGTMVQAGVIDADYRGEILVRIFVAGRKPWLVKHGDRIAQLLILPVPQIDVCEVAELDDTARGANGFGSTGR